MRMLGAGRYSTDTVVAEDHAPAVRRVVSVEIRPVLA
jgi:hypothetical protein